MIVIVMYSADDRETAWIAELERMDALTQNARKEHPLFLDFSVLYVNTENVLESVSCGTLTFSDGSSTIRKEKLLQMITSYGKGGPGAGPDAPEHNSDIKYICKDISLFLVDIEPEQMDSFSQVKKDGLSGKRFWKTISILENNGEIVLEPSIFVFHSLNRLYFTFVQPLKSCLRTSGGIGKVTKRVRMKIPRTTKKVLYRGKNI